MTALEKGPRPKVVDRVIGLFWTTLALDFAGAMLTIFRTEDEGRALIVAMVAVFAAIGAWLISKASEG